MARASSFLPLFLLLLMSFSNAWSVDQLIDQSIDRPSELAFPGTSFIPNKVYSGKKTFSKKGEQRICQEKYSFTNEWSTEFRNVDVTIPDVADQKRSFKIDFYLGNVFFKGTSRNQSAWTCEEKVYSADLSSDGAKFSIEIYPAADRAGNARFQLTHLSLDQLEVRRLKMRRLGIDIGIDQSSRFWNNTLEKSFNALCRWTLNSWTRNYLNDFLTKEVARIVEQVFGSQSRSSAIHYEPEVLDPSLQKLDNLTALD